MSKLVSVVIPAYNHEKFIEKALISVYNQTYNNLEIILIDDNSKDETFEKADKLMNSSYFQKRFKRIICQKNQTNTGAHATLNKAITYAEGEFISILNSDDYYHPERIEKIMKILDSTSPYFFAFSNYVFVNEEDEFLYHPLYVELQVAIIEALNIYPSLSFIFLQKQIALSTGNFFFSKSLYQKVGGFINLRYCSDLDFILQSIRYTEPIYLDESLYYYRIHQGNTFSTLRQLAIPETEVCLKRYFKESEYGELVNKKAPCKKNYPFYFENLIKRFELEEYYINAIVGYSSVHRVVEKDLFKRYEIGIQD